MVTITISAPANGMRDLDNHCKPMCDLLVKMGLIDGDRFKTVKEITLRWHQQPAMLIEIVSIPSLPPTLARSARRSAAK